MSKLNSTLTAEQLRELLRYDPVSGTFTWIKRAALCVKVGSIAGYKGNEDYWYIAVKGHKYPAHRLAWLYVTGNWPTLGIDHINGIRSDNRFENIREATPIENARNRKIAVTNKTGYKSVKKSPDCNRWVSNYRSNGKRIHLGYFKTPEEAYEAYCQAAKQEYGEFFNPG